MYDKKFLDDLRSRVPVSTVASRHFALVKVGHELRAKDNPSVTVNDKKGLFKDHGNTGDKGTDVFGVLQRFEKMSFNDAVAAVARMAGVDLPKDGRGTSPRSSKKEAAPSEGGGKKITKTYDYVGADGKLLYQVCRFEWFDEEDGSKKKSFGQRRPSPDGSGSWVWGLGDIPRSLYRLPDLIEELSEPREEQRTIILAEGEKDCDTLSAWNWLATTNSGGASNFTAAMAERFRDAADVVILEDNDDAGRARTAAVAPILLSVGARVRLLSMADHWPSAPPHCDITDWVEKAGGSADKFSRLLDACQDWKPRPYESQFGAKFWHQQGNGAALSYRWLVHDLIPLGQDVLICGPSGSGKSFETQNIALHLAQGREFLGKRTMHAGVVYCCYEMAASMDKRVIGYRMHHGLSATEEIPFVWITRPPNLYATEENPAKLAAEIKGLTAHWKVPIGAVVIDTHNAATRGSSEIKSEDIAKIQDAYGKVKAATGATLIVVGHTNSEGRHRGSEIFFNAIDTCIVIEKVTTGSGKSVTPVKDEMGRQVRSARVTKQREADDGYNWEFVLSSVEVGRNEMGEPITTMVPVEPLNSETGTQRRQNEWRGKMPERVWRLSARETPFFRALLEAINRYGVTPPAGANGIPASVATVVQWRHVTEAYRRMIPNDDTSDEGWAKYKNKISAAMQSIRTALVNVNVIGVTSVIAPGELPEAATHYLWPADRPVIGGSLRWPERAWQAIRDEAKKVEADPLPDDVGDYQSPF